MHGKVVLARRDRRRCARDRERRRGRERRCTRRSAPSSPGWASTASSTSQSNAAKGQLCWTFDVMTNGVTGASIRDSAGMVVAKLGPAYKAKSCATVPMKALDDDRDEARLLHGLGRHEGAHGRAARARCSPAWRTCRGCRKEHAMDETHADPQPPRKVGRAVFLGAVVGGVSSLYWGKAVLGQASRRALSPVEARIPLIPSGGWRIYTVSGSHAALRPADLAARARRPRRRSRRRSPTTSCGRCRRSSRSRRSTASPAGR